MKHKDIDQAMAAKERAELYFAANPRSPAAVRRPELSIRSGRWVALLGGIEDGIVGVGSTVETALRAFDAQYLAARRPLIDRGALDAEVRPSSEAHRDGPKDKNGNNGHHLGGGEMADMRLRLVRRSLPVFRRFLGAHLDPRL